MMGSGRICSVLIGCVVTVCQYICVSVLLVFELWTEKVCVKYNLIYGTELKIVWGGEVNANSSDVLRFGLRMIEDSIYGKHYLRTMYTLVETTAVGCYLYV